MIKVTLQQIKDTGLCTSIWKKVFEANNGDMNTPFPVSSILDSNGLEDTLWVLENVPNLVSEEFLREFGCWCILQVVHLIKPHCTEEDYELLVKYLETQDESLREAAHATYNAHAHTADFAAAYAAYAYAYGEAYFDATADYNDARAKQIQKLREMLDNY